MSTFNLSAEDMAAIKTVLGNDLNENVLQDTADLARVLKPMQGHNGLADSTLEECVKMQNSYNEKFKEALIGTAKEASAIEGLADLFKNTLKADTVKAIGSEFTPKKIGGMAI